MITWKYVTGCDMGDVAQRKRDLADSREEREAGGKLYTALASNGARGVCRNFGAHSNDESLVACVYGSVCAAHGSVQAEKEV